MADASYTMTELMAYAAAREIENKKSIMVGTGLPIIAAMFAQKTHAPDILIIFEAGGVGPLIPALPISVGDSRTFYRAVSAYGMLDVMALAQAGYADYGFLGAAQIDPYGNINTTVIGDHARPRVRLPGSGGANDFGSLCHRTIIIMRQDKNKFKEKVDFVTTPGYLDGPGAREKAGLPLGTGPVRVITQLAVYGFDERTKRLKLRSLHPGVTVEEVQNNSSFEILLPEGEIPATPVPSEEELAVLRSLDPAGISI
ncbi:MAG: CoA-transferase subunit beta [Desulfotomaculales bacterium]